MPAQRGQLSRTQPGRVAFEQLAYVALVRVQVVGEPPAHADRESGRHPPRAHLGVHRVDEVAGLDGPPVDLPGELTEQRVLEHPLLRLGEQLLLVSALPGDPLGEVGHRGQALFVSDPDDDDAVVGVPLGAVVEPGRGQLRLQFCEGRGEPGGALLERGLGGCQVPGRRQDRLVQRHHSLVEAVADHGGPAQLGRTADQPEQIGVGVRAQPLRLVPGLGQRLLVRLRAEVHPGARAGLLLNGGAVRRVGLGQGPLRSRDTVGRPGHVGEHLRRLGADRLAQRTQLLVLARPPGVRRAYLGTGRLQPHHRLRVAVSQVVRSVRRA